MRTFNGKKLLVLGGTKTECDIVLHAQAKGIYVIVADYYEDSPAKMIADKAVLIDALDVDSLEELCKKENVDGVITGFVDILLKPYYELTKRLNLPCYITPKMLSMSTNKIDFKNTCIKYDVPVPKTYLVGNNLDSDVISSIKFPVFVKPLDGSGSRGAGICRDIEELKKQFNVALNYSASNNAIIEDYITGREFLLDYIAVDGEFRLLSIFDRYVASDRGSAINYSTISIAPSRSVDFYLKNINDKVINMFKLLGFKDGLFFMQGYYDNDKITFFEMGCRLGGSYFNHEQACLDYNALDMLITYSLTGKMVDNIDLIDVNSAKYSKYALDCNYLLKGNNEIVTKITGLYEIEHMPQCIEIQKYHDIGYHYCSDKTVDRPIIVVEIVADTKSEIIECVESINLVLDVFNEKGKSILMEKLDPHVLFD